MRKIKLEAVQPGMVVAADVRNLEDMLLLPAGCELTARHLKILQTWGIPEIQVESGADPEAEKDPLERLGPEAAARLEADTLRAFRRLDPANPVQQELFRLILRRKARQLLAA